MLLTCGASAGASGPAAQQNVTITATSAPWIVLGDQISITGKVTPKVAGVPIVLQQKQGNGWYQVSTGKDHPDGTFSFSLHPTAIGSSNYRVRADKSSNYTGVSDVIPVEVFKWTYLGDIYVRPSAGEYFTDPIAAAGVTYQHPVSLDAGCYNAWGGSAWIDYKLGGQFQTFTATVALGDLYSNSGSTGSYAVIGDGKTLSSGPLLPGKSTKIEVSVTGVKKFRLLSNIPDPTGAAGCSAAYTQVVFGDAQLLGPTLVAP